MSYPLEHNARGSGFKISGIAGEKLSDKMLVGLKNDKWFKIGSSTVTTYPILGITCEKIREGLIGEILIYGLILDGKWSWIPGGILYASDIDGELTQATPPVDEIMPEIGVACTPKCIIFSPQRFTPKSLLEGIPSNPESGGMKVINLFVEDQGGNHKLKVEYEV